MNESEVTDGPEAPKGTVAQRLTAERERLKLSQKQMAERTRLSVRHLSSLESGNYAALPGTTYAIGFTRSYARALGLDEQELVGQLRRELDFDGQHDRHFAGADYDPADPGRIPPKFFTWGAIVVLVLLLVGYLVFSQYNSAPQAEIAAPPPVASTPAEESPGEEPAALVTGPVVLTANQDVWLRVYERDGDRLFENRLADGESYTVPSDANEPLILTGRPQALDVTVGGRAVPPLGRADYTISDVPVDAQSLLARGEEDGANGGTSGAANSGAATSPTPSPATTAATATAQ